MGAQQIRNGFSHVADFIGNIVERRMPINLVGHWIEVVALLRGVACGDRFRRHDPDRDAFLPACVHVARERDRVFSVARMKATDVFVVKALFRTNENFEQRPIGRSWLRGCGAFLRRARSIVYRQDMPPRCARRVAPGIPLAHEPVLR
jgi:hypothetical protein